MIVSERDGAREAAAKVNSPHLSSKFFALVVPPFWRTPSRLPPISCAIGRTRYSKRRG
jgi:hypothetical protein